MVFSASQALELQNQGRPNRVLYSLSLSSSGEAVPLMEPCLPECSSCKVSRLHKSAMNST